MNNTYSEGYDDPFDEIDDINDDDIFNEEEEFEVEKEEKEEVVVTEKKAKKPTKDSLADLPKELRVVASTRGKYYLTNHELLPEVIHAKEVGYITDKLARMLMLLADRYSRKANFIGYSYREDMVASSIVNLCQNAMKFDPKKSLNPFAFYTTAIHNSFLQYMMDEKKQHYIRDTLLLDSGKDPSSNFRDSIVRKRLKGKKPTKKQEKIKKAVEQKDLSESFLEF